MREVVGTGFVGIANGGWTLRLACGHHIPVASKERAEGLAKRRRTRKCPRCQDTDDDVVKEIERRKNGDGD